MKIIIDDKTSLYEIEEEFRQRFPFLKIKFLSNTVVSGNNVVSKLIKNKTLAEYSILSKKDTGVIITSQMTVHDLEQCFEKEYGLVVKVFRNSWRVWLESTVTDGWTLEEQNRQGEALSGKNIQNNV